MTEEFPSDARSLTAYVRIVKDGISVSIDGKHYRSIAELARAYQLPVASVFQRIKKGWTPQQAVLIDKREMKTSGNAVCVRGVTYSSLRAACRALGVSYKSAHFRLSSGRPIDEALGFTAFDYKSKPKLLSFSGIQFKSLAAACRHFRVDKYVVNARINRYGWSVEEALGIQPRPGYEHGVAGYVYIVQHTSGKPYIGITMGSIEDRWRQHVEKATSGRRLDTRGLHFAIREFGADSFSVRMLHKASSHGELCELEVELINQNNARFPNGYNLNSGGSGTRTKGRSCSVQGHRFPSITAACKAYDADRRNVTQRIQNGWSIEEALGLIERKGYQGPKAVTVNQITYASLAQAALAYGISDKSIAHRLRSGWSLEQIFGITEPPASKNIIEFRGKQYPSEVALCKAFGANRSSFNSRKLRGLSLEECLGLPMEA